MLYIIRFNVLYVLMSYFELYILIISYYSLSLICCTFNQTAVL